jgi:hypothetical protein
MNFFVVYWQKNTKMLIAKMISSFVTIDMKIIWMITTHAMKDETIMQILKLFNSTMM